MEHFANILYDALRKNIKNECIIDCSLNEPVRLTKNQVLIMAMCFAKIIKKQKSERIGIAIPPSGVGIIANLAVLFANKIPVNLNFASEPKTSRHYLKTADLKCILTISKVKEKFPDFSWSENCIDVIEKLKSFKNNKLLLISKYLINLLPINLSKKLIGIPKYATNEEVALLFTSGSSGKPKGVMLGHDNIISNINGINAMQKFETDSKILANLPLFHSFGFTVTMWFPLINDIKIVTVPSPLEIQKSIDVIQKEQINVLLGTPTFLNGYLKKGTSNKLKSVKYVIAGAEKSKIEFMNQWENTIDCVYLEGYGLTETSPVCCLNTPDSGIKKGSVGKLLPNIMIKTKNPDTLQDLRIHESGLLCFKGPNIFGGYLKEFEKTLNAFEQDWFITGDIGHLDEQGFVHIEGRLSRFSKIGGEMIPHETIESVATKILNLENEEQISLIVTGRPHETKGEELVLLTTKTINFKELKQKLSNELGNLFVPKIHKKVEKIPVLPTGKLDLQSIKELVNEK